MLSNTLGINEKNIICIYFRPANRQHCLKKTRRKRFETAQTLEKLRIAFTAYGKKQKCPQDNVSGNN